MDNEVLLVTLSHSWVVQEMEIPRWEVPDFFLKLTFHLNKTIYVNEAKF